MPRKIVEIAFSRAEIPEVALIALCAAIAPSCAFASEPIPFEQETAAIVFVLLVVLSIGIVLLHLLGRRKWTLREGALTEELARAGTKLNRANFYLASEPQLFVAWKSADAEPEIEGDFSLVADSPATRRVLAFAAWLEPTTAQKVRQAVDRLLSHGESFSVTSAGLRGRHLEIEGRAVAGRAVLRIRDVSGDRLQLMRLRDGHAEAVAAVASVRAMLDAGPQAAWARDAKGRLTWVNLAYSRAVEARNPADAVERGLELFDSAQRAEAIEAREKSGLWRAKVHATANGERRLFDVVETGGEVGSAGLAADMSEIAAVRAEMSRQAEAHARTLDQLTTAVVAFDRSKKLIFHNAAYRRLWSLDSALLAGGPSDGEILERLRAKRLLPEQADFRAWKAQTLAVYQSNEPTETTWHLPDGRIIRVATSPNAQGGVTYLFDDATDSYSLASQVAALTRVQGETLDALKEGVAVFGPDGRLKLSNPAFSELWGFDPKRALEKPHVDEVGAHCTALIGGSELWSGLRGMIAGLPEKRANFEGRAILLDGREYDCAALPLPDGATLLAFLDVTAGAKIERALTEKNHALVSAEKLRNDFVHHVSYELRTPLTTIIGYAQLLSDGTGGPLNAKQADYVGSVSKSSDALLAIIDNILDLASIDAGAIELSPEEVDVEGAMKAASEGVQDRLTENGIELRIIATDGVGSFHADVRRVRQVLFNLLSNAIGFSSPGQTVTLAAMRRGEEIIFKVSDQGRGIPPELVDRVFGRFETFTAGVRHRGAGLGLSIVQALVELHQGRILVDSAPNVGTTVTCIFPIRGDAAQRQAA